MFERMLKVAVRTLDRRRHRSSRYVCSSSECETRVTGILSCTMCHRSICFNCDRIFDGICRSCLEYLDRVNHYTIQRRDARGRFAPNVG